MFRPIVLKDCKLTLTTTGDTPTPIGDFEAQVSAVTFTPNASVSTFQGLTPTATFSDVAAATWTCDMSYAQDWNTATDESLSRYLHEHEGERVTAVFEPVTGDPAVTATLILTPGPIGGTVNAWATGTVRLGVAGKPTVAAAA